MWPEPSIMRLILKHLSGEASVSEIQELNEWRQNHPDHEREYAEMVKLWNTTGAMTATPYQAVDVQGEWEKFRHRHFAKDTPVIRLSLAKVVQYAAAAVLVLGLLGGAWYFSGSDHYRTGNGQRELVNLADGSSVVLSENSELEVPRTFNWNSRNLTLRGEAFFEVARDPDRPFTASGPKTMLRVLGTAFHLTATQEVNEVEVTEGKVAYWETQTGDTVILTRGLAATLKARSLDTYPIETTGYDDWQSGNFSFTQQPLGEIIQRLQNYYLFDVKDQQSLLDKECTFTGTFNEQELEEVLQELALVAGMDYTYENHVLELHNLDCR